MRSASGASLTYPPSVRRGVRVLPGVVNNRACTTERSSVVYSILPRFVASCRARVVSASSLTVPSPGSGRRTDVVPGRLTAWRCKDGGGGGVCKCSRSDGVIAGDETVEGGARRCCRAASRVERCRGGPAMVYLLLLVDGSLGATVSVRSGSRWWARGGGRGRTLVL